MNLLDKECACCNSEEGATLNESRSQNHVGLNLTGSLRLTSDSIHGATTNLTNAQTCTNCCNTCTKTAAQLCQTFSGQ